MKVLIVEPGKYPREAEIEHTLQAEQKIVGGMIQAVYPWRDRACIYARTATGGHFGREAFPWETIESMSEFTACIE